MNGRSLYDRVGDCERLNDVGDRKCLNVVGNRERLNVVGGWYVGLGISCVMAFAEWISWDLRSTQCCRNFYSFAVVEKMFISLLL